MTTSPDQPISAPTIPSGPGAAAVFAAGLGIFVMAVLAAIGDHSAAFKAKMIFYTPTGPLSGVTTAACIVWLAAWIALDRLWKRSTSKDWAISAGVVLLTLGFILMIPPVVDLF